MRKRVAIAAFWYLATANPAWACGAHPLPYFFLLDRPPAEVPLGAIVLKVSQVRLEKNGDVIGRVLGSQAAPSHLRLVVLNGSSCVGLGRMDRPAYVVGFRKKTYPHSEVFSAIAYRNAWWSFLPGWLGIEVWIPSEPAT